MSLDTFGIEHNGVFYIQFFAENGLVATRVKGVDWIDNVGDVVSILGTPNYTVQTWGNSLLTMFAGQFVRQTLNITKIYRLSIQISSYDAI
mgnify:CR=1 FL=1